jgi:two-component system cell cycle sensor histidine kinase/response regulator CckA
MTDTEVIRTIPPKRILVVDDGPELAKALRMILTFGGGHRVDILQDAESAWEQYEVGKYDLIITDLKLPKMNGFELATAIKQHAPGQRIILITGHADLIEWDADKLSKIDLLLQKPFTFQQLQEAVAKLFTPGRMT